MKIDLVKILMDYESESQIPSLEKSSACRYQLINSAFGAPAKVAHGAIYYKRCCGRKAYDIAAVKTFCCLRTDKFDLHMDGKLYKENFDTEIVMGFNGKVGGGGMILNPFAVLNDGFMDMTVVPTRVGFGTLVAILDKATK